MVRRIVAPARARPEGTSRRAAIDRGSPRASPPHRTRTCIATAIERCPPTPQIDALADAYLAAGVVGPRWRQDAIQVATATIYGADVLVSWNYKHIVRFDRVRGFHSVNVRLGYPLVYIASPAEVQLGDEGEEV